MIWLVVILALFAHQVSWAQNHYTLEITLPLPSGTAGTGLDTDHRIYRAYQGLEYKIPTVAIGGRWPYTYSLSGQPTGMTIEAGPCTTIGTSCTAGTITWPDPQASDASITVRVTDADGDWVEATWGVTVSTTIGANGFCFIDADDGNDTTGNGSLATPWQTVSKAVSSCGAHAILYLRGATAAYTTTGITVDTDNECGAAPNGSVWTQERLNHPVVWIAYPGETPVFDMEYPSKSICVESEGNTIWVEGLTVRNCNVKCFDFHRENRYGSMAWRNTFEDYGPAACGSNNAAIMYTSMYGGGGTPNTSAFYDTAIGNTFQDGVGCATALRIYSWYKAAYMFNAHTSLIAEEVLALKANVSQFHVLGNTFSGVTGTAIWGNQDSHHASDVATGEIAHNNVKDSSVYCAQMNQAAETGEIFIYRNTFACNLRIWNLWTGLGPLNFVNNVIINSNTAGSETGGNGGAEQCPTHFNCHWPVTPVPSASAAVLVDTDNLKGTAAAGIIDANGQLSGSYRTTYLGTRGWEVDIALRRFAPLLHLRR